MGDKTGISWTDATWNPLVGCSRVSEGCRNCYAEREAATRLASTPKYQGLAREVNGHPSWTGEIRLWEPHLDQPLRWRAPRRIFVNSMSDLFHEKVPDEWIDRIFVVMAHAPQHTFQVLTKRPERMVAYFTGLQPDLGAMSPRQLRICAGVPWPLHNVWLGVSVEDQEMADERIGHLLQTPAAVRWVSYEPALGPVDFTGYLDRICPGEFMSATDTFDAAGYDANDCAGCGTKRSEHRSDLNWLVVGGESDPGARPFDLAWARSTIAQCRAAGVPAFVKQLGTQPRGLCDWKEHYEMPPVWLDEDGVLPAVSGKPPHDLCHAVDDSFGPCRLKLRDRKGGAMEEWPSDLRVREYPR